MQNVLAHHGDGLIPSRHLHLIDLLHNLDHGGRVLWRHILRPVQELKLGDDEGGGKIGGAGRQGLRGHARDFELSHDVVGKLLL